MPDSVSFRRRWRRWLGVGHPARAAVPRPRVIAARVLTAWHCERPDSWGRTSSPSGWRRGGRLRRRHRLRPGRGPRPLDRTYAPAAASRLTSRDSPKPPSPVPSARTRVLDPLLLKVAECAAMPEGAAFTEMLNKAAYTAGGLAAARPSTRPAAATPNPPTRATAAWSATPSSTTRPNPHLALTGAPTPRYHPVVPGARPVPAAPARGRRLLPAQ